MDRRRLEQDLSPFLQSPLNETQLDQISTYIDLLVRWNSRVNLSAVRSEDEIVTRHFGESLFVAQHLLPQDRAGGATGAPPVGAGHGAVATTELLLDVGSGAGFPGLPIKIWSSSTPTTLIESNNKKVAFLREVIRALNLIEIEVFPGRAETFAPASATLVTLRAVEHFDSILHIAQQLLAPGARIALLIGESQARLPHVLTPAIRWSTPLPIPQSRSRVLLLGNS